MSEVRTAGPSPTATHATPPADAAPAPDPAPAPNPAPAPDPTPPADATPPSDAAPLRIHEVAAAVGLTPRSIRYYEEMGLLSPSARSQGAYRLFDELDLERLRFIKGLRDDAGFSIAEIRALLEDEAARRLAREAFAATDDPVERRRILQGRLDAIEGQLTSLRSKLARLEEMVAALENRRSHTVEHMAELDAALRDAAVPSGRR